MHQTANDSPNDKSSKSSKSNNYFSLDVRSIALCRIVIGIISLFDLLRRSVMLPGDLAALHTTDQSFVPPNLSPHGSPVHKFLFYRGSLLFQTVIFVLHGIVCLGVIIGFKTRWMMVLNWLLTISLNGRNEYVIDCGDRFMRNWLFWMMQLPWCGDYLSLDSYLLQQRNASKNIRLPNEVS